MAERSRIFIASPDAAECEVLAGWLASAGLEPFKRASSQRAAESLRAIAFDLLIADFSFAFRRGLHTISRHNVRNSKTPTIVIGGPDKGGPARAEAMYLSRPVDRAELLCTISMALMQDRPVRRSPRKTVHALDVFVNNQPSHIIDLSIEGLRLEVPRAGGLLLPPYFSVRVPMIDVTLVVKRMWACTPRDAARSSLMLCGGALSSDQNSSSDSWHAFVEALPAREGLASDFIQVESQHRD
ncbi:MAG: hypothetical protein A3G76_05965 [Acidobacteria bacterium RIFCSPLOWO2_12_FULL_65_11]|nr:MAG: hypothetical protein A3H95_11175 [Acidobacteria bacterium RIFCSPLOWO2_02_FULL_64_15]OFW28045.1 MAG: hypothetical protein A3G76_05965 [Acidobacteria bacterium RIFCSPLOWO2_12_FULL_65_11]